MDLNRSSQKNSIPQSQDLISFTPHLIVNIDDKQQALISEHPTIINALRKEILDPFENKYIKTLKTVYRYVNTLVDAGIVVAAGQRMTEKSRVVEKVYCLSANYFHRAKPSLDWWTSDESKEFSERLAQTISEVLDNPTFKQQEAIDTIHQLCKLTAEMDYFNILEIIEKGKSNEEIGDFITDNYWSEDQSLVTYASKFIGYLRNFDLLKELKDIESS
ncbi:MAG: hypothetical protein ACW98K_12715 [Candidatus Kariarchaeaceae archaeon]|jgi:hypothetical protein